MKNPLITIIQWYNIRRIQLNNPYICRSELGIRNNSKNGETK